MKQFLLIYRRSTGRLMECRELGSDFTAALQQRFAVERSQEGDPDVEVVLLSSPSFEALKRTHARYFSDRHDLAEALTSAFKAS